MIWLNVFTCFRIFSFAIIITKLQGRRMEKKGTMDGVGEGIRFGGPSNSHCWFWVFFF